MFDPEAKQEIAHARPDTSCTFVIEALVRPSENLFSSVTSKRERLERLTSFYRNAKASIVDELAEAGVVVRDLSSSPQLIATAPAETWRELASRLERNSDVDVLPNRMYTAV